MVNPAPLMVLFVSTGNAARSILAESLMRHLAGHRFNARSAGLCPLPAVHPQTLDLLKAEKIPTDNLHTKGLGEFLAAAHILPVDILVTLSEDARQHCPVWPHNLVRVHWSADDPLAADKADMREWKFLKCFNTLHARIDALIKSRVTKSTDELFLQLKDIGMVV